MAEVAHGEQTASRAPQLNEAEAARVALDEAWRKLAPLIDEAKSLESQMATNPSLGIDRWAQVSSRWVRVYARQLAAVQTVYEATQAGKKVPVEEVRSARQAAERLVAINLELQERVPQHA